MKQDIIDNIIKDKDFLEKIINLRSIEEVKQAFKSKGLELSDKDIEIMGEMIRTQIKTLEKVPDDILEKTIGGLNINYEKLTHISTIAKNVALGLSSIAIAATIIYLASDAHTISGNLNDAIIDARGAIGDARGAIGDARATASGINPRNYLPSWLGGY